MTNLQIILLAGLFMFIIISTLILLIKFHNIKVIPTNNKNLTNEELQLKIEQLKIIRAVNKLNNKEVEDMLRLSGNPMHLTPTLFTAFKYLSPVACAIVAIYSYFLNGDMSISVIAIALGIILFWYPTYQCKKIIEERRSKWSKIYSYLWRIQNDLSVNDVPKVCLNMKSYFASIGEFELANGFNSYFECFPDKFENSDRAIEKLKEVYPFDIAVDFYEILLQSWGTSLNCDDRIDNFYKNAVMKYEKYANKVLSGVSATATLISLPFLMVSILIIILLPALDSVISQL